MKRILTLTIILGMTAVAASAEAPRTIGYQGVLKNADGTVVPDGDYSLTFSIYDQAGGGEALWTSTLILAANQGLVDAVLGGQDTLLLPFDAPYWLGITVDGGDEMSPRVELTSTPYAFRALVADSLAGIENFQDDDWTLSGEDIYRLTGHVGIGTASPQADLDVQGRVRAEEILLPPGAQAGLVLTADDIGLGSWQPAPGDVTGVAAGEGLSGGGDAGDLTLAIADGGVGAGKIADDAVSGPKILDGSVELLDLGPGGAASGQVMKWNGAAWTPGDDFGVAGPIAEILAGPGLAGGGHEGSVELHVATGGVAETMLADGAVTGGKLGAAAVTTDKIAPGAVTAGEIAPSTITASQIAPATITAGEISPSTITSNEIQSATIDFGDMASNGASDGQVMKYSSGRGAWAAAADEKGVASVTAGSGLNSSGTSTDVTLAIASQGVVVAMLQDSCVTGLKILDKSVATADLADLAITADKLEAAAVTSAKIQDDAVTFDHLDGTGVGVGQIMKWNGSAWFAADDSVGTGSGGGTGGWTDAGTVVHLEMAGDSVGVGTDTPAAKLHVAGDINADGRGSFGGGHSVTSEVALVAGRNHDVSGAWSAITGGQYNRVNNEYGVICGGGGNVEEEGNRVMGIAGVVVGGRRNWAGEHAAVVGGTDNDAMDSYGFIGGGQGNHAAGWAVVTGGMNNQADGMYAVVSGGGGINPDSSNVAHGRHAVVAGGRGNQAGSPYLPGDSGPISTVSGGADNRAFSEGCSVSGGADNRAGEESGDPWDGRYATVGGGRNNEARGRYAVVAGGGDEWGPGNRADGSYSVISGGSGNMAGMGGDPSEGMHATVGGGLENRAYGQGCTVGGGTQNEAGDPSGPGPMFGGFATVAGGDSNRAVGNGASIGGGEGNEATGDWSAIPGGRRNVAQGADALAAGFYARANHDGSVVISASRHYEEEDSIASGGHGQMVLRADSGIYLTDGIGQAPNMPSRLINTSTGAYLSSGGQWVDASDRNLKENFHDLDAAAVLAKLVALPVTEWNYRREADTVKHVGPTAQDFHALFALGGDDKGISPLDLASLSLLAIRALEEAGRLQADRIGVLEREVAELRLLLETQP